MRESCANVNAWLNNEYAPAHNALDVQVLFIPFDTGGLGDILSGLMLAFVLSLLRGAALRVFWPAAESLVSFGGLHISPFAVPGSYAELPAIIRDAFDDRERRLPLLDEVNLPACVLPCRIKGQPGAVLNMVGRSIIKRRAAMRELAALRNSTAATGSYKWLLVTGNRGGMRALEESAPDLVALLPAVARPGRERLARNLACSMRWLMLPKATAAAPSGRTDACVQIRSSRFRAREDEELAERSSAPNSTLVEFKSFFQCANALAAGVSSPSAAARADSATPRATPLPLFLTTDSASLVASAQRELGPLLSVGAVKPLHSQPALGRQGWSLTQELKWRAHSNRTGARPLGSKKAEQQLALEKKVRALNSSLADWWHLSERCAALVISLSGFSLRE
jgi:hypothetical protein